MKRLVDSIGRDRIVKVLDEFDVRAGPGPADSIAVSPITPLEMARSYAVLATLGRKCQYGFGNRPRSDGPAQSGSEEKCVSLPPASLFLANYLLKDLPPLGEMSRGLEDVGYSPSVYVSRDDSGTWGVAYRADTLLLVRVPGRSLDTNRLEKMMLRLLPRPRQLPGKLLGVPTGVVFRKICVDSGLRATSICPHVILEAFLKGSQPSEWCPFRHRLQPVRSDGQMNVGKP